MHPSEEILCKKTKKLLGKTVVLGITGSIAAVDSFHLIRELIRNGAKVIPVMTEEAAKLAAPDAIEFASGVKPIINIGGQCEHIKYLGDSTGADLFLIYPCSANTISKIAQGIADTSVTAMALTAIGSKIPVAIAPAMHINMFANPSVEENLKTLKKLGVETIGPRLECGTCRVASVQETVAWTLRLLSRDDLKGKKILVIGGRSEEPIDSMRLITNRSSGIMSAVLATDAFIRGANVTLWMGACNVDLPDYIPIERYESVSDLVKMVEHADNYDVIIVPAALADFTPKAVADGKISSEKAFEIELTPVPKVIPLLTKKCKNIIGFKAESGLSEKDLVQHARKRLEEYGLIAVIANDIDSAGKNSSNAKLVTKDGAADIAGTKIMVSESILDFVSEIL